MELMSTTFSSLLSESVALRCFEKTETIYLHFVGHLIRTRVQVEAVNPPGCIELIIKDERLEAFCGA